MRNEQNGFTSVYDNGTVNLHVPVLRTGLRPSQKTLRHYVLNIFCPYSPKKYGGLKSFKTTISFQPRNSLSLTYFLVFLALYQKSHNLYVKNKLSVNKWKIKFEHLDKYLFWFQFYQVAVWFSQTLIVTVLLALSQ
jgi:hypothetical protein